MGKSQGGVGRCSIRPTQCDLDALLTIDHEHHEHVAHPEASDPPKLLVESTVHKTAPEPPAPGHQQVHTTVKAPGKEGEENTGVKGKNTLASKVEEPNILVADGIFLGD